MPESFEFWFLSHPKTALYRFDPPLRQSKILAANDDRKCVTKVGDDCFDPQYGMFPDPEIEKLKAVQKKLKDEKEKPADQKYQYLSNIEAESFHCDKNQGFDIYCGGKVQKPSEKKASLEIWIDISRTMTDVDYPDKNKDCFRKSFVKRLKSSCQNVDIYTFNTFLKLSTTNEELCDNLGFIDQNRLLSWINDSKAHKVIIITDKSLATKGIADYVYAKGGKVKGDANQKELSGKDLLELVDSTKKYCR